MNLDFVGGGGGYSHRYEKGGDARRLAEGCKFLILISLRVFWVKRHKGLGLHSKKHKENDIFYSFYLLDSFNRSFKRIASKRP